MIVEIVCSYFNASFNFAIEDVKNVWMLGDPPVKLIPSVHRGLLTYRLPGLAKRIRYRQLKNGWVKKQVVLRITVDVLPF